MTASAPVQYGADPLQFVIPYAAPSPNAPTVIMFAAAGWGSAASRAGSINSNALPLQAAGYCVFIVSYRGDNPPVGGSGSYPANQQGGLPAWPMVIDDGVAGSIAALALAGSYNGTTAALHFAGGSAGGSIAALVAAELLDLGVVVDSVTTLSMNTDWWTAIQIYYADLNSGSPTQAGTDNQHLTNIANALGTFHDSGAGAMHPYPGTLEWHLNGVAGTFSTGAGWGAGYPTGSDIWTRDVFTPFAPAQRCALRATRCWWNVYNSSDEDIPTAAAFTFAEAVGNVGSMVSVTIVPGQGHGYNLWNEAQAAIIQFIQQTSSH